MATKREGRAVRPRFPRGMRPATLAERKEFYERELDLRAVARWMRSHPHAVYALIPGRHTGLVLPEYAELRDRTVVVDDYRDLPDLREYIVQYLPEGVYYDRNLYTRHPACGGWRKGYLDAFGCPDMLGQELAFDIDPENITCPVHGDLRRKLDEGQGVGFCKWELGEARRLACELVDELSGKWEDVRATYSGRGFHVHVMDGEAYKLSRRQRAAIAREAHKRYPIDRWVTSGEMRLIRLPHSLNAIVSRICLPLARGELERFSPDDPRCVPGYLRANKLEG